MGIYNTELFCKIMIVNEALFGQSEIQLHNIMKELDTNIDFDFNNFYLCLTGLKKKVYTNYLNMHRDDYIKIFTHFKKIIIAKANELGIKQINAVINYDGSKQIIFLIKKENKTEDEIYEFTKIIQDTLEKEYQTYDIYNKSSLANFTVMSDLIENYDQMANEFENVRKLNRMSFFKMEPIVFNSYLFNQTNLDWKLLKESVDEIEGSVFVKDVNVLEYNIKDLFLHKLKNSFRFDLCYITLNDLNRVILKLKEQLYGINQIMDTPLKLDNYACIEDLAFEVLTIFKELHDEVASDFHKMSDVTNMAIDWIKNNYMKDIGLQEVACELNIAPAYLSRTFSKDLKITMNSYITRLRIERAKILLMETNDKIQEIANKVGIVSGDYFSVLFKKITGLRPQEYRDCYRK